MKEVGQCQKTTYRQITFCLVEIVLCHVCDFMCRKKNSQTMIVLFNSYWTIVKKKDQPRFHVVLGKLFSWQNKFT